MGQKFALWPNKVFSYEHQRLLAPQSGAMGYGLPAALAASLACKGRQVISLPEMGISRWALLSLAVLFSLVRMIILVLNNGSYGTIRMHQERDYQVGYPATLQNPDFVGVARAYGLEGSLSRQQMNLLMRFHVKMPLMAA